MLTVFYQLVYVKGFADNIESIFKQKIEPAKSEVMSFEAGSLLFYISLSYNFIPLGNKIPYFLNSASALSYKVLMFCVTENFTSFYIKDYFLLVSKNPFSLIFQATKVWYDSSQA